MVCRYTNIGGLNMRKIKCACGEILQVVGRKRDIYDTQGNLVERCPGCQVDILTHKTMLKKLSQCNGGFKIINERSGVK